MNDRERTDSGGVPPGAEELYRWMAVEYAERYGAEVKEEQARIEREGAPYLSPGLDRKVMGRIARMRRGRYIRTAALTAAGLLILLLTPALWTLTGPGPAPSSAVSDGGTSPSVDGGTIPYLIPLSFTLPPEFQVGDTKLDNGKSVYYLSNRWLDDVVMTLEVSEEGVFRDGLTQIEIGGVMTYGMSGPDYCLLTFEKEEVVYVLTCKHDINTLVSLGQSILV